MTGKPARIREAERLLGIETTHAQKMRLAAERKAEREAAWKPMTPEELDRCACAIQRQCPDVHIPLGADGVVQ